MMYVPLASALIAGSEEVGDDILERQGWLIRRLRWQIPKLLSSNFLIPVYRVIMPDLMNSIVMPKECLNVIGAFDPAHLAQGDMWDKQVGIYSFIKRNFGGGNKLFYDFTNPESQEASFMKKGLQYFQRENKMFFDRKDLNFLDPSKSNNGIAVLFNKLPSDDRGELIPDFMVECLAAFVTMTVMKKDMYLSVRGQKQANMPQIRMMMSEMRADYKKKAQQSMIEQNKMFITGNEVVPITMGS